MHRVAWIPLMLLALCASDLHAAGHVTLQTRFERWSWDEPGAASNRVGEWTTRLLLDHDVSPTTRVEIATGFVRASQDLHGPDEVAAARARSLFGLLDTKVRLTYRAGPQLQLRVGINGATGITELSEPDARLAQTLAARILAIDGNRLGEGADVDLGCSYAREVGRAVVGLGLGYLRRGNYTPRTDTGEFRPGSQTSLGAGVDVSDAVWMSRTNTRIVLHGASTLDGAELFDVGNRFELQQTLRRRFERFSLSGSLLWISFGKARIAENGSLVSEPLKSSGNELYTELAYHRIVGATAVTLQGGARFFSSSEQGQNGARRLDVRATAKRRLTRNLQAETSLSGAIGRLHDEVVDLRNAPDSNLSGFGVAVSLIRSY